MNKKTNKTNNFNIVNLHSKLQLIKEGKFKKRQIQHFLCINHVISYSVNTSLSIFIIFVNICLISDNIDVTKFYALLFQCITKVVPVRRKRFSSCYYPWYNVELRSLRNKKNGPWKKFSKTNNDIDFITYNQISDAFFYSL